MTLSTDLDAILAPYNKTDGPGAAIAVAQHGRTLYSNAVGMASIELGVAYTAATRGSIGSVTKHFCCAALLLLQADGKLSIDDPVGKHLPELPPHSARPTLRQLMTMTGGLRCYLDVGALGGFATQRVGQPWATQARQSAVNFAPGDGVTYCNGGYMLLSHVIQRVSGQSFESFLSDRLFKPLRLDSTDAPIRYWPVRRGLAERYIPCEGGWRRGFDLADELLGDGCMVSSLSDMLRWAHHLRSSDGPVSMAALTPDVALNNGAVSTYGLGLVRETWRGTPLVHHGGAVIGAMCFLAMFPAHGMDVVVFCNQPADVRALALQAAAAVIGSTLQPAEPARKAVDHAELIGPRFLEPDTGALLEFADQKGGLFFSFAGGPSSEVVPGIAKGDDLPFVVLQAGLPMHFRVAERDDQGVAALQFLDAGTWRTARRVDGAAPAVDDVLKDLQGEFGSADAAITLNFERDAQGLLQRVTGPAGNTTLRTTALAPDLLRALLPDLPYGYVWQLERQAGPSSEVNRLIASTGRTRRMVFDRVR